MGCTHLAAPAAWEAPPHQKLSAACLGTRLVTRTSSPPPHLTSLLPSPKGFLYPGGKPLQLPQNLCHREPRRVMWSWARSCFGHRGSRSSISSGANSTQESAAESQPGVGWEQITISLPRKTNWTCQEERNSSTSHTYGLILMDMYEHKGRRITFWLG